MSENSKMIIVIAACLIAVFTSFMHVYSRTLQRSADDLVKIKSVKFNENLDCVNKGGKPQYNDFGEYYTCHFGENK